MSKNKNKRQKKKNYNIDFEIEQDESFSFIAGYTSWGFPYGTTWEETDLELDEEDEVFT